MIELEVFGVPIPKGSLKPITVPTLAYTVLVSDNTNLKHWARAVSIEAQRLQPHPIWEGPVGLWLRFQLRKPVGLPKTRHSFHTKKPDLDKLQRAIKDALKGIIYRDDAQVVFVYAHKLYADRPSVVIRLEQVTLTEDNRAMWQERHLAAV